MLDKIITTEGTFIVLYFICIFFSQPCVSTYGMNKTLQNAIIAGDRLFEIMDLEREELIEKKELTRRILVILLLLMYILVMEVVLMFLKALIV